MKYSCVYGLKLHGRSFILLWSEGPVKLALWHLQRRASCCLRLPHTRRCPRRFSDSFILFASSLPTEQLTHLLHCLSRIAKPDTLSSWIANPAEQRGRLQILQDYGEGLRLRDWFSVNYNKVNRCKAALLASCFTPKCALITTRSFYLGYWMAVKASLTTSSRMMAGRWSGRCRVILSRSTLSPSTWRA